MTDPQTQQPDVVTQMVQDPDFGKMAISEQRKALAAHDPMFQNAGDDAIGQFVQAHQAAPSAANQANSPAYQQWKQARTEFGGLPFLQKMKRMILSPSSVPDPTGPANAPGSFEGHPENIGQYVPATAGRAAEGAVDISRGNVALGGHHLLQAVGNTVAPMSPILAAGAPAAFATSLGGGLAGGKLAQVGAKAVGATPDQQALAGDFGNLAGGYGATKIPLPSILSRALLLGKTPQGAYESALKPSTTMSPQERANIVSTGISEKIPVSQKGLENLGDLIDNVNAKIKAQIDADPTRPVNPSVALQNLGPVRQRFSNQVNPASDLNAIEASGREFAQNQHIPPAGAEGPTPAMNAADAQLMKQGTYRAIGDKAYGELSTASKEAQKALARGLKDELARQFPELNDLNARDSRLIDLNDSLERAVGRIGNHQMLGISTPIVAGAAKAVTNSNKLAAAAGILKAVLDNPAVKSRLAIALGNRTPLPIAAQRIQNYSGILGQFPVSQSRQSQPESSPQSAPSPNQ